MNKDIFEGKWKQVRGQAREWWGKLTDDDLERIGGKYDQFVGTIQEKYGYTREQAEAEIDKHMAEQEAKEKEAEDNRQVVARESQQKEADMNPHVAIYDPDMPPMAFPPLSM